MQKIGFNQRYGLQQAVFDGTKTMTRRLEKPLDNAVINYRNSYSDRPAFNIRATLGSWHTHSNSYYETRRE